jgi:ABC-type multidrug transport system ATPase subunit
MLTVENLSCFYGGRGVFAPVSFIVARQEIVVLRGSNGIGKTTLLRTLAGLPVDYTGNYTVENVLHRKSLQRKGRITSDRECGASSQCGYPVFYVSYNPPLNPQKILQMTFFYCNINAIRCAVGFLRVRGRFCH